MARTRGQRRDQRTCTNNCAVCAGPVLERPKCARGKHQGPCLCLAHALEATRATPGPAHDFGCASLPAGDGYYPVGACDCRLSRPTLSPAEIAASRGVHARISDAMRTAAGLRVPPASSEGDDVLPGGVRLADLFANSPSRRAENSLRVGGPRRTLSIDDRIRARDEQLATGRAPQATTWRTQDGREIPIATMEDTHLHNTIRYLERKVAEARAPALLRLATDRERAEEIRRLATAAFSSYAALIAEAKRRELGPTLGTDMADLEDKIAAEQKAASETDAAARMRLVAEEMGQGPKKDG